MSANDPDSKQDLDTSAEESILSLREMPENLGFVIKAFCRRFFAPIRFSPAQEKDLQTLAQKGHLVYVMESSSVLYYLFLNFWCLNLKLPFSGFFMQIILFLNWIRITNGH